MVVGSNVGHRRRYDLIVLDLQEFAVFDIWIGEWEKCSGRSVVIEDVCDVGE